MNLGQIRVRDIVDKWSVFMFKCSICLTTPGRFISAIRYSGSPTGGSTSKVNAGL